MIGESKVEFFVLLNNVVYIEVFFYSKVFDIVYIVKG